MISLGHIFILVLRILYAADYRTSEIIVISPIAPKIVKIVWVVLI